MKRLAAALVKKLAATEALVERALNLAVGQRKTTRS
jgi:hypothetical protein